MKKILFIVLLIVNIVCLTACSSEINVGYVGTNRDGLIHYQYISFDGKEQHSAELEAQQNLKITYETEVKKGSINFQLIAPNGETIWETETDQTISDQIEITLPEDGLYKFVVDGSKTKGSFTLKWD
jgi:hypothetical protein